MLPHDMAKFLVDRVNRTLTLDVHEAINLFLHALLCLYKLSTVCWNLWPKRLVCEIILNGIRQNKIAIG